MANKLYNDNVSGYFVEGAKGSGYAKCNGSYPGDATSHPPVSDYNANRNGPSDAWFQGKQGGKARTTDNNSFDRL